MAHPPAVQLYRYDTRVHYPFGRTLGTEPEVDVVYRTTPVYTPETLRQIKQSVSTAAASRQMGLLGDKSAGVPKAPVVRELFVDALSGNPIGEYNVFHFLTEICI